MAPALQRVRDYLTMRAEAERAHRVPVDEKAALARALTEVREARRAAEVLWSGACPAQAWRTAKSAFENAIEAARTAAGTEASTGANDARSRESDSRLAGANSSGIDEVARTLALGEKDGAKVKRADDDCRALAVPALDAEIVPAHVESFENLRAAIVALERALVPFVSDAAAMRKLRLRRQIVTAAVSLLVLASIVFAIRMQFRTWATASAAHESADRGPHYDAENVVDHAVEGEWLLPDGTAGWVDVHYSPSKTISKVHLLNACNLPYYDRATKDFTIELYGHDRLLKSVDGSFPQYDPAPKPMTVDVGRTAGVDRLRVVVKSWFLKGGGLAEISVD